MKFVNGKFYTCKEQLTYHIDKKHMVGKLPVGVHSISALVSIENGADVRVFYNPDRPKKSYLPDNNGIHIK